MLARILGGEIEPGLRHVLWSVFLGSVGQFAFFAFFAIWALEELEAPQTQVGLAFGLSAAAAIAGGIVGGRLSDRVGRRPLVLTASIGQTLLPALLIVPDVTAAAAFAVLVAMGFLQPVRGTSQRALLADVTEEERRVQAFGAFRVVNNAGAALGPLTGAALVTLAWPALHAGIAAVYGLSILAALRLPTGRPGEGATTVPSLRLLAADGTFLLVFAAGLAGWAVYNAFEVLLPVALTQTHGLAASAWGPLYVINAIVVVLFQLRITRWTRSLGAAGSLTIAMLLMALPFLLLELSATVGVVVLVVLVFVVGEMLWAPHSEALAARLAPPGTRGVYLGTLAAATWAGAAVTPAVGLRIRELWGDGAMWVAVACSGLLAAVLYMRAAAAVPRVVESERCPRSTESTGRRTSTSWSAKSTSSAR